jgi:hypothetical protein
MVGREIGEKAGMVPVGNPRQDDLPEVTHDVLHGLTPAGRTRGKSAAHITGGNGRQDRVTLYIVEVVGHPVDHLVAEATEAIGIHGMLLSS